MVVARFLDADGLRALVLVASACAAPDVLGDHIDRLVGPLAFGI